MDEASQDTDHLPATEEEHLRGDSSERVSGYAAATEATAESTAPGATEVEEGEPETAPSEEEASITTQAGTDVITPGESESPPSAVERPLSNSIADPTSDLGISIDHVFSLDARTLLVEGWSWDPDSRVGSLTCHPVNGGEPVTLDSPWRFERTDVTDFFEPAFGPAAACDLGRLDLVRLSQDIPTTERHRFELVLKDGSSLPLLAPHAEADPWHCRDHLLEMARSLGDSQQLFEELVEPALRSLLPRYGAAAGSLEAVIEHGVTESPDTTLVVPLSGDLELLEHQMASLADDPDIAGSELLYVLSDPSLRDTFERRLFHLTRLYRLPVRGFVTPRPLDQTTTLDQAATLARGPLTVFLRGDVLAARPGWLGRLRRAMEEHPNLGVVGFRLVSENRSLRHAGIGFEKEVVPGRRWSERWEALGLPDGLPMANETRTVAAVSGACLGIGTDLYRQLGDSSGGYFDPRMESLDLCLRALDAGRANLYLPDALYHLDALGYQQGSPPAPDTWEERYDHWLFDHRWASKLDQGLAELTAD